MCPVQSNGHRSVFQIELIVYAISLCCCEALPRFKLSVCCVATAASRQVTPAATPNGMATIRKGLTSSSALLAPSASGSDRRRSSGGLVRSVWASLIDWCDADALLAYPSRCVCVSVLYKG